MIILARFRPLIGLSTYIRNKKGSRVDRIIVPTPDGSSIDTDRNEGTCTYRLHKSRTSK